MDIELLPPAIRKPRELWTGKQVISTLLHHLRKGKDKFDVNDIDVLPGVSCERKTKTPPTAFGAEMEEHLVLVRDGELLRGVLDKAAFGATDFSLVHAVYEAYGPNKAGLLLNAFGRLFTAYLQYYSGHSCRMEDLVLTTEADQERRKLVEKAYNIGSRAAKAWADSDGGKVEIPPVESLPSATKPLKPVEAATTAAKIGELLSGEEGKENSAALDGYMQSQINPLASKIIKACLPSGLAVPFPANVSDHSSLFRTMTTQESKHLLGRVHAICLQLTPRIQFLSPLPSLITFLMIYLTDIQSNGDDRCQGFNGEPVSGFVCTGPASLGGKTSTPYE